MKDDIDSALTEAGPPLAPPPEAVEDLLARLHFVERLLKEVQQPLRDEALLLYRAQNGQVETRAIGGGIVVGRDDSTDLVINSRSVSRRHFSVESRAARTLIRDLQSRGGTFVNGARIEQRQLVDGDVISAGDQTFVFLKKGD